jgi:AcrR family transcriptional regulator
MATSKAATPRRRPVQRRSRRTVDAIVEAAARVLESHGYAAATTNRIAERAGVSIGSLYEYFPNKDAVLAALFERHTERGGAEVLAALEAEIARGAALPELLRALVAALLRQHRRSPELHRVLFEEMPHPPGADACVLRSEEAIAHRLRAALEAGPVRLTPDADLAAHLVVQTAEALAHRFVLHGIHGLPEERFADEVARLLRRYLGGEERAEPPPRRALKAASGSSDRQLGGGRGRSRGG